MTLVSTASTLPAAPDHQPRLTSQARAMAKVRLAWLRELLAASPAPMAVQDGSPIPLATNAAYDALPATVAAQLLRAGQPGTTQAVACPLPDAPTRHYLLARQPLASTAWQLLTATDTTDLCRGREDAQAAAQAQQAFLATASHEIRTPLNGILGLTRLLQEPASPEALATYLYHLHSSTESLLAVVNGILDFTKLEAGQLTCENEPFEVEAVVRRAADTVTAAAHAKHLALRVHLPPDPLPVVTGDAHRLGQILLNLLGNAVKFTTLGEVSLTVTAPRYEQGQVQLQFCVADTGIGIAPEQQEQVFRPFAQAAADTTRRYGGTGLGLAICRRLVELLGGRLWLESTPGQGSRFWVALTLPVSEQLPAPATFSPAPGLLRGLRVLLVEDNPVNSLLATELLRGWQTHATLATDGEQALELAALAPYDVVLMDLYLPRLSGLEATIRLRASPGPNQHTPVIALTASTLSDEAAACLAAGFSGQLAKPYHENALYLLLAHHTGRSPGPAASAAAPAPAYGFEGLGRLARDGAFIGKMQRLFVETVPEQFVQLEAAVAARRWPEARQVSHALKSTYGILQIEEGLRYIRKIEENLKAEPKAKLLQNMLLPLRLITQQMVDIFQKPG